LFIGILGDAAELSGEAGPDVAIEPRNSGNGSTALDSAGPLGGIRVVPQMRDKQLDFLGDASTYSDMARKAPHLRIGVAAIKNVVAASCGRAGAEELRH
jgi:hypothetical protein